MILIISEIIQSKIILNIICIVKAYLYIFFFLHIIYFIFLVFSFFSIQIMLPSSILSRIQNWL